MWCNGDADVALVVMVLIAGVYCSVHFTVKFEESVVLIFDAEAVAQKRIQYAQKVQSPQ